MADEADDFNSKTERSINVHDLKTIGATFDALKSLEKLPLGDASITLLDDTGTYGLGEIWWNSEMEQWQWDPKKYGEA